MLTLESVKIKDYKFLYDILDERSGDMNISHRNKPVWELHIVFCGSDPYPHRWIIWEGPLRIGTCYVTDRNEIGLFILKQYQKMGSGKEALQLILQKVPGKLYANINPKNLNSIEFFQKNGFRLIQQTYEI